MRHAIRDWLFLGSFSWHLKRADARAPTYRLLRKRVASLWTDQAMPGSDTGQHFNLLLATALRASVLHLQDEGLPRAEARGVARKALISQGSWMTKFAFAVWLKLTPDPVAQLAHDPSRLERSARALHGDGMKTFATATQTEVVLNVAQCPFAEYFWNVAEPDLTAILCEYDRLWMAQVNLSDRPVRVVRRGTLAAGANACDFRFQRLG